ncbi:hypothetical protein GH714_018803 [Hevea brasiliensis]|uniref:MSP domain-containing protein n=1 Tax=Hevea brasiliensis TaxID=3981 RepID=A0A6A6LTP2_HEVBR|nr:hypothetical protein GH714_018803 [Hevea brasiliensis]
MLARMRLRKQKPSNLVERENNSISCITAERDGGYRVQEGAAPGNRYKHFFDTTEKIRRYVYHDVIRLGDAQKLFDCAFVQSYTTNSAKVVFLNPRPQTRQFRGSGNVCGTCDRSLQDPYLFCSLSCKVDCIIKTKGVSGLSSFLFDCNFLSLSEPVSDDGLMTPDSVLEPNASTRTSSSSVTMQAPKEAPHDMQCKDKFLLQSVAAPDGTTMKDITPDMFNKENGKDVEEFKLRVVYIPANPPSPVPEESEEESSLSASVLENGNQDALLFEAVSRSLEEPKEKSSEAWSTISKLTEEKASVLQQNQQLRQEVELMRRQVSKTPDGGFSLFLVVLVGLFGILVGYVVKRT